MTEQQSAQRPTDRVAAQLPTMDSLASRLRLTTDLPDTGQAAEVISALRADRDRLATALQHVTGQLADTKTALAYALRPGNAPDGQAADPGVTASPDPSAPPCWNHGATAPLPDQARPTALRRLAAKLSALAAVGRHARTNG